MRNRIGFLWEESTFWWTNCPQGQKADVKQHTAAPGPIWLRQILKHHTDAISTVFVERILVQQQLYCISVWCLRICLAFAVCCFTSAFCPWGQLVHQKVLSSRGRHRCTDFGHIFKFSWGPFFIEGLYVGNMNQAFSFHLNFFFTVCTPKN